MANKPKRRQHASSEEEPVSLPGLPEQSWHLRTAGRDPPHSLRRLPALGPPAPRGRRRSTAPRRCPPHPPPHSPSTTRQSWRTASSARPKIEYCPGHSSAAPEFTITQLRTNTRPSGDRPRPRNFHRKAERKQPPSSSRQEAPSAREQTPCNPTARPWRVDATACPLDPPAPTAHPNPGLSMKSASARSTSRISPVPKENHELHSSTTRAAAAVTCPGTPRAPSRTRARSLTPHELDAARRRRRRLPRSAFPIRHRRPPPAGRPGLDTTEKALGSTRAAPTCSSSSSARPLRAQRPAATRSPSTAGACRGIIPSRNLPNYRESLQEALICPARLRAHRGPVGRHRSNLPAAL